jgi:hypothetical protein
MTLIAHKASRLENTASISAFYQTAKPFRGVLMTD